MRGCGGGARGAAWQGRGTVPAPGPDGGKAGKRRGLEVAEGLVRRKAGICPRRRVGALR